jgi:hypothetical protein
LATLLLAGCSRDVSFKKVEPELNLILELSKPDKDGIAYTKYRTVKDASTATEIKVILLQADESKSVVSMARNPDRKISIVNTSPTASSEPRVYGIWHEPNSEFIEVVSESAGGGYTQLNPDDSKSIIKLLK